MPIGTAVLLDFRSRFFAQFRNERIHPINEPHVLIRDQRFDGRVIAQLQNCLLKTFNRSEKGRSFVWLELRNGAVHFGAVIHPALWFENHSVAGQDGTREVFSVLVDEERFVPRLNAIEQLTRASHPAGINMRSARSHSLGED